MSDAGIVTLESAVTDSCGSPPFSGQLELRIAAIFVIFVTSLAGTLFPIVSRRVRSIRIPEIVFEGTKYFGSGVILATAFVHLLAPAFAALTASCLSETWLSYPFASALAMASIFFIFIVELVATRAGASYLKRRQLKTDDPHSQGTNVAGHSTHGAHIDEARPALASTVSTDDSLDHKHVDEEASGDAFIDSVDSDALSQLVGVLILEFGVIFHSITIGLTLAVVSDFNTLFTVIVFHQMFEGLGLGTRLSVMKLPSNYTWLMWFGAFLYSSITPLGIAIGLGVRTTYNPDSATALIVSGVLDSLSAGILLYTSLVELIAHDFIFSKSMIQDASNLKVTFSVGMIMTGAGIMALLGRWA